MLCGIIPPTFACILVMSSSAREVPTSICTSFNRVIEILNSALGTDYKPEYFDNPYSGYQNLTQAHTLKAKELLGFESKYNPEEGIQDYMKILKTSM